MIRWSNDMVRFIIGRTTTFSCTAAAGLHSRQVKHVFWPLLLLALGSAGRVGKAPKRSAELIVETAVRSGLVG